MNGKVNNEQFLVANTIELRETCTPIRQENERLRTLDSLSSSAIIAETVAFAESTIFRTRRLQAVSATTVRPDYQKPFCAFDSHTLPFWVILLVSWGWRKRKPICLSLGQLHAWGLSRTT